MKKVIIIVAHILVAIALVLVFSSQRNNNNQTDASAKVHETNSVRAITIPVWQKPPSYMRKVFFGTL